MGFSEGVFTVLGLSRGLSTNAATLREVVKLAFTSAGLPTFASHGFRKTLGSLAKDHCPTPEQDRAWSLNLGHENIATTLSAYTPVAASRQAQQIRETG